MFVLDVRRLRPALVKFRPKGAAKELQLCAGGQLWMVAVDELRLCDEKELRLCSGRLPENLTFKIKFGAANICSKFEKICQIFSAHPMSCIDDRPHHPTN